MSAHISQDDIRWIQDYLLQVQNTERWIHERYFKDWIVNTRQEFVENLKAEKDVIDKFLLRTFVVFIHIYAQPR